MNLIENAARSVLLKIDEPIAEPVFYPLPVDKYIVFTVSCGMVAKQYPWMADVLQILASYLNKNGISIVQVGGKEDEGVENLKIIDLRGKTSVHELYWVIKNAQLVLSGDTFVQHIASVFNVNQVTIFGLTDFRSSGPFFGDKSKQVLIEPDRMLHPATFNPNDDRPIKAIKIEQVLAGIESLLHLDILIPQTIFMGEKYNQKMFEVVPDTVLNPQVFGNVNPIFRMDYMFNEDILAQNLRLMKGCIVTNRIINIELLKAFRHNISYLAIEVTTSFDVNYIKKAKKAGINVELFTTNENEEYIKELKYLFFEEGLVKILPNDKKPEIIPNDCSKLKYKTKRFLISNNQIFGGKFQWRNNLPFKSLNENEGNCENFLDFWGQNSYNYIFKS